MHAVATSPDDLFFRTAARDASKSVLSVRYKERKKCGSSWIRVGDFDSNLLKKLGLNRWFSEEKQRAWRAGCRPDWLFRHAQFSTPPGFPETPRPAARRRGTGAHAHGLRCAWSTGNVLEKRRGTDDPNGRATERAALHGKDATALAAIVEHSAMRSDTPLLHGEITSSIMIPLRSPRELGFGFREYLYARALERLLIEKGHTVDREVAVMSTSVAAPFQSTRSLPLPEHVAPVTAISSSTPEMAWNRSASPSVSTSFSADCYPLKSTKTRKKCLSRSSVSSKARRYPDFIRKNSPNPNEFAQFAFNVLMRPDDHATKSRSSSRWG